MAGAAPPQTKDPVTKEKPVFRYSRLVHIRWFLTLPIIVWLLGVCTSFIFRPMTFTAGQSVVFFFEGIGPYWPITFGIALVFLLWALYKKNHIEKALFFSMAVSVGLFIATLFGVIAAGSGWIGATGALMAITYSFVMGVVFNKGRD